MNDLHQSGSFPHAQPVAAMLSQVESTFFRERGSSAGVPKVQPDEPTGSFEELERLYRAAEAMLADLDRLGLHHAGAYLSMAMDIMRQSHPDLTGD